MLCRAIHSGSHEAADTRTALVTRCRLPPSRAKMLRRCRSALHRTREELIDPRLSRRRFQRLLHFGCRAHVDTALAQLLLGESIRAVHVCDMK